MEKGDWKRTKLIWLVLYLVAAIMVVASTALYFSDFKGKGTYYLELVAKVLILGLDIYCCFIIKD
jgi:hypothetical protein